MFCRLSSVELALILLAIVLGTTLLGDFVGRRLRGRAELREPFGVVQAALLGLVALLLAFGLTMAVGRYDARRAAVVSDANAIGTAYLRAQTLKEPIRTRSLVAFRQYTDADIRLPNSVPGTRDAREAIADDGADAFATFMTRIMEADVHALTINLAGRFTPNHELERAGREADELNRRIVARAQAAGALRKDIEPVALLGIDETLGENRRLIQATLDLLRGLGLAASLSDDAARRESILDTWAGVLDRELETT